MRIAFLTTEFITEANFYGGLASYLGRVTSALVARGHHVEVFVTSEQSACVFSHDGVIVQRVPIRYIRPMGWVNLVLNSVRVQPFYVTHQSIAVGRSLARALRKRAREITFDIVQASSYMATGLWIASRPMAPLVIRVSSYAPIWTDAYRWARTLDRRIADWLELIAISRCNYRYAPSQLLAEIIRKQENLAVDVIEPPFHLENIDEDDSVLRSISDHRDYALHFGSLGRLKGSGVLAKAVEQLLTPENEFRLVLVGKVVDEEGKMLVRLKEQFPGRVDYLGVLPPSQLYPLIRDARIVILPSLIDNLPNTCLEAMAFGRVVIGSRGASFDQLITHGVSGYLVQPGDHESLYKISLQAWALSENERKAMGKLAEERIEKMCPAMAIPRLESYFSEVIASQ